MGSLGQQLSGERVILCADQLDRAKQQKLAQVVELITESSPDLHLLLDGDKIANIEKSLLKDKDHLGLLPGYQHIEGLQYAPLISEPIICVAHKNTRFLT